MDAHTRLRRCSNVFQSGAAAETLVAYAGLQRAVDVANARSADFEQLLQVISSALVRYLIPESVVSRGQLFVFSDLVWRKLYVRRIVYTSGSDVLHVCGVDNIQSACMPYFDERVQINEAFRGLEMLFSGPFAPAIGVGDCERLRAADAAVGTDRFTAFARFRLCNRVPTDIYVDQERFTLQAVNRKQDETHTMLGVYYRCVAHPDRELTMCNGGYFSNFTVHDSGFIPSFFL